MTTGVVLARTGSAYRVHTSGGDVVATLRGKLKHRDESRSLISLKRVVAMMQVVMTVLIR